jgi:hypothetical protein
MLDGKHKKQMDAFWDRLGYIFVKLDLTANTVTVLGLLLTHKL